MTDQEIQKDREERINKCTVELSDLLKKYELNLLAKDSLTPNTQVIIAISFVDTKVYPTAELAQPVNPLVPTTDLLVPAIVPEGVQSDGSVVINADSLK